MQARRTMPDEAGLSSVASAPPASEAPPRGPAASAPPAASTPPAFSPPSTSTTGAAATGFWSYVTAGANASVGRDANVPTLAHFAGGCCQEESL
jgi:hypothetical protein